MREMRLHGFLQVMLLLLTVGLIATGGIAEEEPKRMRSNRIGVDSQRLMDPNAPDWDKIENRRVLLDPTPVENLKEISPYMVATTDRRKIGKIREVEVKTVHNGKDIFFRLEWQDATQDVTLSTPNSFVDACGILFSMGGEASTKSLAHMGSPDNPVNAWYWRADLPNPLNLTASGLGTTQRTENNHHLLARSLWEDGSWKVVLCRSFQSADYPHETVRLQPGETAEIAFAVMEGSNRERGGLKSYSVDWEVLLIDK